MITVDWGAGSGFPYSQAAANTRVVGAVLGRLVNGLRTDQRVDGSRVHVIGHSLGAHIAGYAGNASPGIGRITGAFHVFFLFIRAQIISTHIKFNTNIGLKW